MNWLTEVERRKDDLIQDLKGLLSIESIKDETSKTLDEPMGEKIAEALNFVLRIANETGFETKNVDGYAGHAELKGDGTSTETIGILCHLDVVPPTGTWTSPPFEPTIREGKLFARGAIDDKGPTMAAFYAVKLLKELNLPIKHNIRLIFGTDEESGMSCMKHYREVEKMPRIGFAPDANFPIIHAEKGQINVKLELITKIDQAGELELISFKAGNKGNMVPETAQAKVVGSDDSFTEKFSEYCQKHELVGHIEMMGTEALVTVRGQSAHGMEPYKGINAGLYLAHFLSSFSFQSEADRYIAFLKEALFQDFYGESLGIHFKDEVTGQLTVNAGILEYIKGEGHSVHLNIRCPVHTDFKKTLQKLTSNLDKWGIKVTNSRKSMPHYVPQDAPMIKILQEAYEEVTGDVATLLSTGGATYARFMESGVAYGAVFPGKIMTAHQKDEYIELDDLLRATAIYARSIYGLANLKF